MPSDAPTIDYRELLEGEQRRLQAELAEIGYGDDGGSTTTPISPTRAR